MLVLTCSRCGGRIESAVKIRGIQVCITCLVNMLVIGAIQLSANKEILTDNEKLMLKAVTDILDCEVLKDGTDK